MANHYNINLIKARASYSPSEMATLFAIDRKTCFRWIKLEGLKVIEENTKPLLVMGSDLIIFIKEKQSNRKTKLSDNEYYCMKCHKAVKAKNQSEQIVKTGKTIGKNKREQLNKIGLCGICGTKLNKFVGVYQTD